MTEIKLYKSPLKSLKLVGLTLPFVALGIHLLIKKNDSTTLSILLIIFFGLGLLIGLFNMIDWRPQIIINKIGIWDRTTNQNIINWEYIHEVESLVDISGQKFIPLVVDEQFARRKGIYRWALNLNKSVGARDINLNISYININVEKFMTLLNILNYEEIQNRDEVIEMYRDRIK